MSIKTHKLPRAKARLKPIFCQVLILSVQMKGNGKIMRKKSVTILGIAIPKTVLLSDTQEPSVGFPEAGTVSAPR